jgi:hypothetical protein
MKAGILGSERTATSILQLDGMYSAIDQALAG